MNHAASVVPFEQIEMTPREYRTFVELVDGVPQPVAISQARSRLVRKLRSALPADLTFHHLLAQEFMRRQQARLDAAVRSAAPPPDPPELAPYRFYVDVHLPGPRAAKAVA